MYLLSKIDTWQNDFYVCLPLKRYENNKYIIPNVDKDLSLVGLYAEKAAHVKLYENDENIRYETIEKDGAVFFDYPVKHVMFSKFAWCYALFEKVKTI